MKICMFVDFMAIPDEDTEYNEIEKEIREVLPNTSFERGVRPHDLDNKSLDVYIFDFGGVLSGCEDTITSMYRGLIEQTENKPNTLFVIWSVFTKNWYMETIRNENPELVQPNVIFREDGSGWEEKLQSWVA